MSELCNCPFCNSEEVYRCMDEIWDGEKEVIITTGEIRCRHCGKFFRLPDECLDKLETEWLGWKQAQWRDRT